jgi:SAM-dependent methyltransferase
MMSRYEFFSSKKVTGFGRMIGRIANRKLAGMVLAHFPSGTQQEITVLEIGPGLGAFADELVKMRQLSYKAYEPDTSMYEQMRGRGFQVEKRKAPPVVEQDTCLDAVIMLNVIEHMQTVDEAERLIADAQRVLKEQGILFVVVPSFLSWGKDFYNFDYTHTFVTTELRIAQLLADNGFGIEKTCYHYGCFFSGTTGRIAAGITRAARYMAGILLPRRISRHATIQKLGMLFAENIIVIGRKL